MSDSKKVLTSIPSFNVEEHSMLTEVADPTNSGRLLLKGVMQRKQQKNQNGRVYPDHILEREVEKYQQLISERRALGELDHSTESIINLKNVSHNVIDCYFEGNDVIGTIEILPTPCGNIAKALIQSGIKLGISSRGLGSVKRLAEGTLMVQDDFELVCFDLVSNPSTRGAFMSTTLTEGVNGLLETNLDKYLGVENILRNILIELK
jgi:hypothetical protein